MPDRAQAFESPSVRVEDRRQRQNTRLFPSEAGARRFDGELRGANVGTGGERLVDQRRSDRPHATIGCRRQHRLALSVVERETKTGPQLVGAQRDIQSRALRILAGAGGVDRGGPRLELADVAGLKPGFHQRRNGIELGDGSIGKDRPLLRERRIRRTPASRPRRG